MTEQQWLVDRRPERQWEGVNGENYKLLFLTIVDNLPVHSSSIFVN